MYAQTPVTQQWYLFQSSRTVPLCIQSSAAREPVLHLSHDWITDTEETDLEFCFHQEGDLDLQMGEFQ